MAESFRCPNCGALNPSGAEWCGQCLTRFRKTPPPPPPPLPGAAPAPDAGTATTPASTEPRPTLTPGRRGAFNVTEAGIKWVCARCDTENPLEAQVCSVCGSPFADTVHPPKTVPERDPNTVAMYSLFFPGAGHWYLELKGQAVARAVLSTWVVLIALIGGIQGSLSLAIPFAIAAFALWGLAAHDAFREARREPARVILKGRTFVYVVMGLLMLMVVLLISVGLRARG